MPRNVVLIGPMGAGKSTVGRQLAHKLNYEFVDTDHVIEERSGADIPWIFDVEGEAGFRDRESNVLSGLVKLNDVVVATGGGIVLRPDNRVLLKASGLVIYLTASIEQLVLRTFKDKKRPLLQVEDPKSKIKEIIELRDPLYRQIADEVIVTDGNSTKNVVRKISELIK